MSNGAMSDYVPNSCYDHVEVVSSETVARRISNRMGFILNVNGKCFLHVRGIMLIALL